MAAPGGFSGTDFKQEEGVFLGFTKAQLPGTTSSAAK